ncbi:diguanylate phosphodiesterase [Pseudodesulfovibrio sediminis]|uniref:Diguanylate phosphodiesterase n=1 Tax=Pseudodesulfovibrio sediminis TaxID=2810563 RepID=A0ABM7P5S4_9BACT|nr:diguanylate phosphodiesterase [Pseudodesulfovibrio sediminis]
MFRSSDDNFALINDESQATSSVIADGLAMAMTGMDLDTKILINFPEQMLIDNAGFALPRENCVVEILENVTPNKKTLRATQKLKDAGYTIAVDDYFGQSQLKPFIELADIVKVDILELATDFEKIEKTIQGLPQGVKLLAEKVEDQGTFEALAEMGFDLFQGFFFSRPEIIPGKKLTSNELTKLQLLGELSNVDFEPVRLSEILQSDPHLSFRLLRYINSVGFGLQQSVTSLKRAIDMLGMVQAKQWLRSTILADLNPSPKAGELAYLSVHRAKFLESVCTITRLEGCDSDILFIAGLFSLLDTMLGLSMEDILNMLPLDDRIVNGLQGHGEISQLLQLATSYERGKWDETADQLSRLGVDSFEAELIYVRARSWTQEILGFSKPC